MHVDAARLWGQAQAHRAEALTSFAILCERMEGLMPFASGEAPNALSLVLQGGVARAQSSAGAVALLLSPDVPYGAEALTLARSVWELAVSLKYMCTDPSKRELLALRYLAHAPATRRRVLDGIRQVVGMAATTPPAHADATTANRAFVRERLVALLVDEGRSPERAARKAEGLLNEWAKGETWGGVSVKHMALAVKLPNRQRAVEYGFVYPHLSQHAHATSGGLQDAMAPGTPGAALVATENAITAAYAVMPWVLHVHDLANGVLKLGRAPEITALYDELQDRWRRAGIVRAVSMT